MYDTQRVLGAKSFFRYLFLGDTLVSLRCLPVAEYLDRAHLEMNLTLSAWTADIGTDPLDQSREGPELTKKKSYYLSMG